MFIIVEFDVEAIFHQNGMNSADEFDYTLRAVAGPAWASAPTTWP